MNVTAIHTDGDMYRIRRECDLQLWAWHRHRITSPLIKNNREPDNKVGELVNWTKMYMHQYHHVDDSKNSKTYMHQHLYHQRHHHHHHHRPHHQRRRKEKTVPYGAEKGHTEISEKHSRNHTHGNSSKLSNNILIDHNSLNGHHYNSSCQNSVLISHSYAFHVLALSTIDFVSVIISI